MKAVHTGILSKVLAWFQVFEHRLWLEGSVSKAAVPEKKSRLGPGCRMLHFTVPSEDWSLAKGLREIRS